jgi:ABC-type multidrug transport system permease subunit
MTLIFGSINFNFPIAVVLPNFNTDAEVQDALNSNSIPNTQEFLNYLNNNSYVGDTIVKSHVVAIGSSLHKYEDKLKTQEISLIVRLPSGFENSIAQLKNGTWSNGQINIELWILNIHEDYQKNIYFGFERKLKAYYDNILTNETEISYIYRDAVSDRNTFPRMWTIGSGGLVYLCLSTSMIIGASFIFNEKNELMRQELAIASIKNQALTYTGKIFATLLLTIAINFTIGSIVIFFWVGLPMPADFLGFILITIATVSIGALFGSLLGALIPEQVFTVPTAAFIGLATLFLCGGFTDIELFDPTLRMIVQWIPFTYSYSIFKSSILTGAFPPIFYIIGLIAYIIIFAFSGWYFYKRFVIKSK